MSVTIQTMDDHETLLMSGTLEERVRAFKMDAELMKDTTKFISEIIETATFEANKRKLQNQNDGPFTPGSKGNIIGNLNNRARGFCDRIINALCPCFNNNEFLTWAPYRFRFSRP